HANQAQQMLDDYAAYRSPSMPEAHRIDLILNEFLMPLRGILTGSERQARHLADMAAAQLRTRLRTSVSLATLDAMAGLARRSESVVHVVVQRVPGVVDYARAAATAADVDVEVDLMVHSIRARFSPRTQA